MTDRDKSILEEPEKMCEYCCNFDKEHIGMDCTALCKLTMTLAYAEDYGGNCMFYNVPKEQIIVPPCKAGDTVYMITPNGNIRNLTVLGIDIELEEKENKMTCLAVYEFEGNPCYIQIQSFKFGKTVFLTKEEAEAELEKRGKDNEC